MGFFSWITDDTKRSIANAYSERETFKVIMTDDKGNQFVEENYEGYGVFGGKDYHELLSEMNGGNGDRTEGIGLAFNKERKRIKYPSLSEDGKYREGQPESCKQQGFFYDFIEIKPDKPCNFTRHVNRFGNIDTRERLPVGYVHIRGQRLGPIARKVGARKWAVAFTGFRQGRSVRDWRAITDGIVCSRKIAPKIRAEIARLKANREEREAKALEVTTITTK
jgi:hypothetical protein